MKKFLRPLMLAILACTLCVAQQTLPRQLIVASYYAHQFHGRTMANGKPFDMYAMTAAHKTLPLGVCVYVTNAKTNASVVVQITDRGPYIEGREIDLSLAAAQKVGIIAAGTGKVYMTVLNKSKTNCDEYRTNLLARN
jgi:rare lipoprotein A